MNRKCTHVLQKAIFSIFFLCLCTIASAQYDSVFKIPYPKRYETLNVLLRKTGDSAFSFRVAAQLLEAARKRNDEQDLLAVEEAILAAEFYWRADRDRTEEKGLALIRRAEKINCQPVIIFVYGILGAYHDSYTHNYARAFEYYERYLKGCKDYAVQYKEEFPDFVSSKYTIALTYYRFYDYRKAMRYGQELLREVKPEEVWYTLLINTIVGMSYVKLQSYDSSLVYFENALKVAPHYPDLNGRIGWEGISTGNIGLVYYLQKKYDLAIPYLLKAEELTMRGDVPDNTVYFAVYLANIYLQQGNPGAAEKQLSMAREAVKRSDDLDSHFQLYTTLSKFYRQRNDAAHTLQYLDSSMKYKDSLASVRDITKRYVAEISVADERREMSEQLAEKEKQRQILIRNGSILLTILALIYVLLFYNRKLLKQKHRREQLQAEKQIAETKYLNAQNLLNEFTRNITEKNELIESLKSQTQDNSNIDILNQLQQSTLLTDEQWGDFRELFEKVHGGYLYRLKEKMPGLTPAETRFMALSKLKLSNKEMAAMLGNSPDAIRQYRARLRKKYNMAEQDSIEELAETI